MEGTRLFAYPLRPSIVIEAHVPSCSDRTVLVVIYGQRGDGTWQTLWSGVADPIAIVAADLVTDLATIRAGATITAISASPAYDGLVTLRGQVALGEEPPLACAATIATWSARDGRSTREAQVDVGVEAR